MENIWDSRVPGKRQPRECKPDDDENNYRILQKNTNTSCSLPLLWHLALLVHLTHMLRFSSYSSNVTTACVISRDTQSKVLRPTQEKISHFGDVLPSQSLGSVLRKTKPNKTNNTKPKWSEQTRKHTKIQTETSKNTYTSPLTSRQPPLAETRLWAYYYTTHVCSVFLLALLTSSFLAP